MSATDQSACRRQASGLQISEVADGLVVFSSADQQVHHLNQTAAAAFALCDGATSDEAIAAAVADAFGGGRDWPTEVRSCLDDLAQRGLVG